MARLPPVMVVSGSEDFLRRRNLRAAIASAYKQGVQVEYLDGEDSEAVSEYLAGGMFFDGPLMVVCSNPSALDTDVIDEQQRNKGSTCLLLHHEGNIKASTLLGKAIVTVPKRFRMAFAEPGKPHLVKDAAIKFLVGEAASRDKELGIDLAEAIIDKVGTDYGLLSYEIQKVSAYMDATDGGSEILPAQFRATMIRLGQANFAALVDAVGRMNIRSVLRETTRVAANFPEPEGKMTLAACSWVGNQGIRWLHAVTLDGQKAGVDEAASRMNIHPYRYKRFILPAARRWGSKNLSALVKRVSRVENAAKTGHMSPWVKLECALVVSCRGVKAGG